MIVLTWDAELGTITLGNPVSRSPASNRNLNLILKNYLRKKRIFAL